MTTIPTITPDLRLAWLREHAAHCCLLAHLSRKRPVDPEDVIALKLGLEAAENTEKLLKGLGEEAEGSA